MISTPSVRIRADNIFIGLAAVPYRTLQVSLSIRNLGRVLRHLLPLRGKVMIRLKEKNS